MSTARSLTTSRPSGPGNPPSGILPSVTSQGGPVPRLAAASLAALVLTATGCATVKPSEREVLSRPEMNPAVEGMEEQFQSHVESAREGGFGGHGAAGGGCGCG